MNIRFKNIVNLVYPVFLPRVGDRIKIRNHITGRIYWVTDDYYWMWVDDSCLTYSYKCISVSKHTPFKFIH